MQDQLASAMLVWGILTASLATWLAVAHVSRSRPRRGRVRCPGGMATAGGVGATFAIGVSVIGIAILLEGYHDKLGTTMSRMPDAMADWE